MTQTAVLSSHAPPGANRPPVSARVLILIDLNWYGGELVRGIQRYATETAPGAFRLDASEMINQPGQRERLKAWVGDGIIVRVIGEAEELHRTLRTVRVPVVNVAGYNAADDLPSVMEDDRVAVRMASEHLLERKLHHFAFYGIGSSTRHRERAELFTQAIEAAGATCESYLPHPLPVSSRGWRRYYQRLTTWLKQLPPQTGIMASTDHLGWQVLETARSIGIKVPDDLAVLGTTNNELICRMTDPTLSSVAMAPSDMGYEAAALLHRMIAGEPAPARTLEIAPAGVISRQSTHVLGFEDAHVREAMRFIEEYAGHPIQVNDLVAHLGISRRSLERRFQAALGHGPHKAIQDAHLSRAKKLLSDTRMSVGKIAAAAGFTNAARFTAVFREHVGLTPSQYRSRQQTTQPNPQRRTQASPSRLDQAATDAS